MRYESTLKCSIGAKANISGTISSNFSISANFNIPTQVDPEHFTGEYEYAPVWYDQAVSTANKYLDSDIVIDSIQMYETSNESGGLTLII